LCGHEAEKGECHGSYTKNGEKKIEKLWESKGSVQGVWRSLEWERSFLITFWLSSKVGGKEVH